MLQTLINCVIIYASICEINVFWGEMKYIKEFKSNKNCETCSPHWQKEYYLGTQTGDYVCSKCGETCSEETYQYLKEKKLNEKKN